MKINPILFLLVLLSGCTSVRVTPGDVGRIAGRDDERAKIVKTWKEAVWIANWFLASEYRKTLPQGEITLDAGGMAFVTGGRRLPIRVRCSPMGDLLIPFGMIAQERSDGFVVGSVPPHRDREIDNTLFKQIAGSPLPNYEIADLILHELTHVYFKQGTVSFPKTVLYYGEAVFLFRYRSHSMEKLPFRTDDEFYAFVKARSEGRGNRSEGERHEALTAVEDANDATQTPLPLTRVRPSRRGPRLTHIVR